MADQALHHLSAAEMAAGFAARTLSPVDVTEAVLARVEAWEPELNAMYLVLADEARAAAARSEARWRAGEALSALDGVPITLKENLYTKGHPAPLGTAATALEPKLADSPVAARVAEGGCVLIGKTTMPDFGMLSSGVSSIHGITRNPWRLDRNPAGSSSGAAAAAAAAYGPLHMGTDIGGSVRLPATNCGLFALKPSLGRIPIDPPYLGRAAGPMTRSVRDSALLMRLVSRPDARDFMSLPYRPTDYAGTLEGQSARGLRIGLLLDMGCGLPLDPAVRAACEAAAKALEGDGAQVEPMPTFLTGEMFDSVLRFFEARSFLEIDALPEASRAKILPFIVHWCSHRARHFSGSQVMAAYNGVVAMRAAAIRATAAYDFVITPTSPVLPCAAELPAPTNDPENALAHIAFTVAYNMSEQPAASINWTHTDDGLPVGVQLVGARFDDLGVLRLARLVEQLRPVQRAWPEPGAGR